MFENLFIIIPFVFGLVSVVIEPFGLGKKKRQLERQMLLEPTFTKITGLHKFWLKRVANGEFLFWKTLVQTIPLPFFASFIFGFGAPTLAATAGIGLGVLILLTPIFKKYKRKVRLETASIAAEKLTYIYSPEEATQLFLPLANSNSDISKLVAIHGLRGTGTATAQKTLEMLSNDKSHHVAEEARLRNTEMGAAMRLENVLSVEPLSIYVKEHTYWRKKVRSNKTITDYTSDPKPKPRAKGAKPSRPSVNDDPIAKLREISQSIDEIVYSQMGLRRSFPDVFCISCYARAESFNYIHWNWVSCKQCKDAHDLHPGVKKVIGQIGGDTDWSLKNGELIIGLWNEENHQARFAEADELEIIGGKSINYDWAISALVTQLHDRANGYGWKIAVRLLNDPVLEANTLQLLRNLDPSFQGPNT